MPQTIDSQQIDTFLNISPRQPVQDNHVEPHSFSPPLRLEYCDHVNKAVEVNEDNPLYNLLDTVTFQTFWTGAQDASYPIIASWIRTSGLYDNRLKKWKDIDSTVPYHNLVALYQRIITYSLNSLYNPNSCEIPCVCDTVSFAPPTLSYAFKSMPSLAIYGIRSTFPCPGPAPSIDSGRTFHASPIEVMLEKDVEEERVRLQMLVHAWQYFRQQANRHTLKCLLLTENTVKMYTFDCNGLLCLDAVNVHEHPADFIGFILALAMSGTSTKHELDYEMIYHDGQMSISSPDIFREPLEIVDNGPLYVSDRFIGPRTVCWKLRPAGLENPIILKISSTNYSPDDNMYLESQMLELIQNLPGVGKMLAHHEKVLDFRFDRQWVPAFRCLATGTLPPFPMPYFVRCKLLLEFQERSILDFDNRSELLHVLRDAITTHQSLWKMGIWHDDIRPGNIRIANPATRAAEGKCAVLIGFARAKFINSEAGKNIRFVWDLEGRDKNTFKSRYRPIRLVPWLGYLHDIESFLLVLINICTTYLQPHVPKLNLTNLIAFDARKGLNPAWDSPDHECASNAKHADLHNIINVNYRTLVGPVEGGGGGGGGGVLDYFGEAFRDLIGDWVGLMDSLFAQGILGDGEPGLGGDAGVDAGVDAGAGAGAGEINGMEKVDGHYALFLGMIDKAIQRVEEEEREEEEGCVERFLMDLEMTL